MAVTRNARTTVSNYSFIEGILGNRSRALEVGRIAETAIVECVKTLGAFTKAGARQETSLAFPRNLKRC